MYRGAANTRSVYGRPYHTTARDRAVRAAQRTRVATPGPQAPRGPTGTIVTRMPRPPSTPQTRPSFSQRIRALTASARQMQNLIDELNVSEYLPPDISLPNRNLLEEFEAESSETDAFAPEFREEELADRMARFFSISHSELPYDSISDISADLSEVDINSIILENQSSWNAEQNNPSIIVSSGQTVPSEQPTVHSHASRSSNATPVSYQSLESNLERSGIVGGTVMSHHTTPSVHSSLGTGMSTGTLPDKNAYGVVHGAFMVQEINPYPYLLLGIPPDPAIPLWNSATLNNTNPQKSHYWSSGRYPLQTQI